MSKENNFKSMVDEAIDISEDKENSSPKDDTSNPYRLDKELLDIGFDFDNTAIYIPFTEHYQTIGVEDVDRFETRENIFLKAERNPNKKLEIKLSWCIKKDGNYHIERYVNIDFLLNSGDEKQIKDLNRKLSFSARKYPSSEGTYVSFVEDFTSQIVEAKGLEVFKEIDFEFPTIDDEDVEDDDCSDINSFDEYSEDIQKEAKKLLESGKLFQELQNSISLTHQGHHMTRDSLILQESSVFVGDGVHGLLDGESGEGKTDLAFSIGYNFPSKYVKILRNVSPKNIYYDCESYNDDFNILIFDDLPLNDDMINILKELADNTKKVKELKTVINGKAVKFTLEGKFIVILTYAKTIEDVELANRLYNVGVNIIDKSNGESLVKHKIRDNSVIGGNFNPIIERTRSIIQASIHNLIEKNINVFNPFLSIFNPIDYNNRDVNHFVNMVKAKTFFDYYQRKQIKVNDDLTITIGSFEDFTFVNRIWSEDSEAQKFKLSEQQKKILNILPCMTQDEALDYVEELTDNYKTTQSKKAKDKLLDGKPTKKTIIKALNINSNTLTNLLDKSKEASTTKSLIELGLADKINLEDITYKPNIYYKIKKEGDGLFSSKKSIEAIEIQFQETFSDSLVKQTIIINLLFYCNILLNEIGFQYMKKYCDEYVEEIDLNDYDSYFNMLNSFFEGLDYDKMCVDLNNASLDELTAMINFKEDIRNKIFEKYNFDGSHNSENFSQEKKKKEKSQKDVKPKKSLLKSKSNSFNRYEKANKDFLEELNIDCSIAFSIVNVLANGEKTLEEIRSIICADIDPSDIDNPLPLKVEVNVKKLVANDLLEIVSYTNKAEHYAVSEKFSKLLGE